MSKKNFAVIGMPSGMEDYQADSDLHHLTKAHQIKKDPKRHKKALDLAKKRMAEMKAVADAPIPGTESESDGGGTQQ